MARVRKSKPTLESFCFSTPEQKLLRFLLSEPTTEFTPRVLSSRLKGIRGLGGVEGIKKLLRQFEELGLVEFLNNGQEIRLKNDELPIKVLKIFCALCDLQGVQTLLEPISTKGVLYGSRAEGQHGSDSDYDLFVVSDEPDEVEKRVGSHPLGKKIELRVKNSQEYLNLPKKESRLAEEVSKGILMWGSNW